MSRLVSGPTFDAVSSKNIAGGVANSILYQTAPGQTSFIPCNIKAGRLCIDKGVPKLKLCSPPKVFFLKAEMFEYTSSEACIYFRVLVGNGTVWTADTLEDYYGPGSYKYNIGKKETSFDKLLLSTTRGVIQITEFY